MIPATTFLPDHMWTWLKRQLGAPELQQPAPHAEAVAAPRTSPVPLWPEVFADEAAGAPPRAAGGPRRPLVGRNGQVVGFELQPTPAAERFLATRGDTPGALLQYRALLVAAEAVTTAGRSALLKMPAVVLARPEVAEGVAAGMLLQVDNLAALPRHSAAALRSRGAQLGVADGPPAPGLPADFVVVQVGGGGMDNLLLSAQRWRELLPQVAVVGLGFDNVEDMESALRGPATLAGGQFGRSRETPPPRPLGAEAHRICELLNHLVLDHDTGVVAQGLRADAALTYRLLRYANSPAVGAQRGIAAVDEALQLLGRRELQRWLSVQLMLSAGSVRHVARALEESALVRGRLLESLAQQLGDAHPGAHFTLGLLSVIEPLLQLPLADALAPLHLGADVQAALLRREGPWADRLRLLDLLENGDSAEAEALAMQWGLDEAALAALVDDAWGWSWRVSAAGAG